MPRYSTRSRKMKGRGLMDWIKKAHSFIKKNKLISRLAQGYSMSGLPYAGVVGTAGKVAGMAGYGKRTCGRVVMRRRRMMKGSALRPA
jgi:hypothetical protein